MERERIETGSVVYVKSGRDSGSHYAVVGVLDEEYILIADGRVRKADKPKKKKIKHVKFKGDSLTSVKERIENKEALSDKFLKSALAPFNDK